MKTEAKYTVGTIQKGINVLNLFKRHSKLSFTDIQKTLNYNKSTLFRILYTLEKNNYLSKDKNGRYELGLNIFILGNQISRIGKLRKVSEPYLKELTEETNFTSHMGIIEGLQVLIVGKYNPLNSSIKMVSCIGRSVPAHCTGQGKVLLAYSCRKIAEKIIKNYGLKRFTLNTIIRTDDFFVELDRIRERGYAIDNSEHEKYIHCIAFPIMNEFNELEAAISITGLVMNFSDEEVVNKNIRLLQKTRDKIREKMNYIK
jgi:DNA-binding IclR family transcriptional regulator